MFVVVVVAVVDNQRIVVDSVDGVDVGAGVVVVIVDEPQGCTKSRMVDDQEIGRLVVVLEIVCLGVRETVSPVGHR